ncbi:MAG: DUF86 domain-containing protein [Chloroflexota bacterium]
MSDPSTWRDAKYLADIRASGRLILEYTNTVTREELMLSVQLQDAVIRRFQVIGEAARRISDATQVAHPSVRWRDIVGMRHRLVHDYVDVDLGIVWTAARVQVPALLDAFEQIVVTDDS